MRQASFILEPTQSTEFRLVLFLSDLVELTCFLLSRMG